MMVIISAAMRLCDVKYISNFKTALFVLTMNNMISESYIYPCDI
jgi:hypothetical protein